MNSFAKALAALSATVLCFGLTVLLVAWPKYTELRQSKNWDIVATDQPQAELDGVSVDVDQARAFILPSRDDRASVYLRLGLKGAAMKDWTFCDLALTDSKGRQWLPLTNDLGRAIQRALSDNPRSENDCSRSLNAEPEAGTFSYSGQTFLLPVEALDDLRVQLSGLSTRPKAISLPFKPVLRQIPQ